MRHDPTRRLLVAGLALAPFSSLVPAARAQDGNRPLQGEVVHFYVGYSPGGGYDLYARMLAPHFEKLTGATVVVENRPGGGGLTALNQLVRARPDGLAMMMLNGEGALMGQLTDQPGISFDMTKVSILGRVAMEQRLMLVRSDLPSDPKELAASKSPLKFSATSRLDNVGDVAAITCETLQLNCRIIVGYKGSKEASLALLNGEVDAITISDGSGYSIADSGRAKIISTIGSIRSPLSKDTPTIFEQFQIEPERRKWMDFRISVQNFGRVFVAPPAMDPDRLRYVQDVWRQILTDPAVIAEGEKTQRYISYAEPAQLADTARKVLGSLSGDDRKQFIEIILKKYS